MSNEEIARAFIMSTEGRLTEDLIVELADLLDEKDQHYQELIATKQSGIDSWARIVDANEKWIADLQAKLASAEAKADGRDSMNTNEREIDPGALPDLQQIRRSDRAEALGQEIALLLARSGEKFDLTGRAFCRGLVAESYDAAEILRKHILLAKRAFESGEM